MNKISYSMQYSVHLTVSKQITNNFDSNIIIFLFLKHLHRWTSLESELTLAEIADP